MSDFCKKCKQFMFSGHRCPPQWEIWDEDNRGDDYYIQYANSAGEAGEEYAQECDGRGDHEFANGEERGVRIRKTGDIEWVKFVLFATPTIEYGARELK